MAAHVEIPGYVVDPRVPPIVALVLIVIVDRVAPVPFLPAGIPAVLGTPLLVAGVALWVWGVRMLLRRGESPNPQEATAHLVTDGPYRLSRNPIYTGGTTALVGLSLLLDTGTGVAVAVVLWLVARSLTIAEEHYLAAKFGDEWSRYRSHVRRWI